MGLGKKNTFFPQVEYSKQVKSETALLSLTHLQLIFSEERLTTNSTEKFFLKEKGRQHPQPSISCAVFSPACVQCWQHPTNMWWCLLRGVSSRKAGLSKRGMMQQEQHPLTLCMDAAMWRNSVVRSQTAHRAEELDCTQSETRLPFSSSSPHCFSWWWLQKQLLKAVSDARLKQLLCSPRLLCLRFSSCCGDAPAHHSRPQTAAKGWGRFSSVCRSVVQ
ncbi:uncharacterized protein LOC120760125 isoform X2 [Hirundo rustica]|uniref:uncharacterized protein LOC120760125 isoform X2 n=1 Tax=Hirundo rustica TaxID=43150 RepID=UPI001A948A64|nr:uncharacterized protein LOC120760125 isoform X2 [Hirundo rustica]